MSAIDTFDWFARIGIKRTDEELQKYMLVQRAVLLRLRNEDEKHRFVENFMKEIRAMKAEKKKTFE